LIGVALLVATGVQFVRAVQLGNETSAYQHARACPAGAAPAANCLQRVRGSVAGVLEAPSSFGSRIPAEFALDVRTGSTTLHLEFGSDSPMLRDALDGDPAVVTMWRGVPVHIVTEGRSDDTTSVPQTASGGELRGSGETLCGTVIFVVGAWGIRRKLKLRMASGQSVTMPALTDPTVLPLPPSTSARGTLGAGLPPAGWARLLDGRFAGVYIPLLLTGLVVFGGAVTTADGTAARALRHAPACAGGTNLAACVGDFTAVINGVRGPTNGGNAGDGADVSFVTADGAINTWATIAGKTAPLAGLASADENAQTQLRIRVWRRSVIGAEIGGSWYWSNGDPPGYVIPAMLLAVSLALLLLLVRLRIHRHAGSGADKQDLLFGDLGQAVAAVGSVALLVYGFWAGAILGLVALAWLGLSLRQSLLSGRMTLDTLRSS
jgi:hypothetical protein